MKIYLIVISTLIFGCSSFNENTISKVGKYDFNSFLSIKVGGDTKESLVKKLDKATEKLIMKKSDIGYSKAEKWLYKESEDRRISMILVNGIAQSISINIRKAEPESDIKKLLKKIDGNWKIISAPVVNPHAMPFMCYLEDEKKGLFISINAHRKAVESVTQWNTAFNFKRIPRARAGNQYCIAGHCASVSKPDDWKYNHCAYLKKEI